MSTEIINTMPSVRIQLIQAVNSHGLMAASYYLDRIRDDIDREKCKHDNRLVRQSLIRQITAKRYQLLRRTWQMLCS